MKKIALLAAAAAITASAPVYAATIMNGSGITVQNIGTSNLNDESMDGTVYLFREGQNNGMITYLLHYGRASGDPKENTGSFDISLDPGETFTGVATTFDTLTASDPRNRATYSTSDVRGLETPSTLNFGDSLSNTGVNPVHVTFDFKTNVDSLDEARFFIRLGAVPEPASWTMMILGVGFVGTSLRSRRRKSSVAIA